ncbi:hypothetical protein [Actinomadura opuntiae]|uniref:hypothetical protein n=1 Tax=Actinomadura sp. OS1-43 TaxID=604315 RepID=UPI00255B3DAC|nr:hypothetical protein [Actinomadura sp. OS1-43]MDL4816605.1 hypothetical protein [Actinomadura sp. OS1-43]
MEPTRRPRAVPAGLGLACLFEALTVLATQDEGVRAMSPWQDDPYDAMVSLAQFAVPALAAVIALRLLAWRAPGGPDRLRQTVRATAAMTALIGLTLAFEWAAVAAARPARGTTWALIAGLAVNSVFTVIVAGMLARCRGTRGRWQHDWLGDVLVVVQRIPVLRRWATPNAADLVRRHAMTVFVLAAALAAAGIVGALAIGERWTNPWLVAWALVVEFTSNLAFCVITNAVAGFIARPERTRTRRAAEASIVAGCVAIQVAMAFRTALWPGPLTSVADLSALTLGAGAATAAATGALLMTRGRQWQR